MYIRTLSGFESEYSVFKPYVKGYVLQKDCVSFAAVWCNQNQSALWTGQMGYSPRRNWVHRRRNDDVCSLAGSESFGKWDFSRERVGDYF